MQTRNDARVVVAGSMEMFTNNFLQATNIHTQGDLECESAIDSPPFAVSPSPRVLL